MSGNVCLITGGRGYLGSVLTDLCRELGLEVFQMQRGGSTGDDHSIPYSLGTPIPPGSLPRAKVLIHCAYDFAPLSWDDINRVNVLGSKQLFEAALAAGVEKIIFISSVSAYDGCHSLYGRAKLLVEEEVKKLGGVIIRPGLVYGDHPGGMVGKLRSIARFKLIPIVGGHIRMYLCHDQDLKNLVRIVLQSDYRKVAGKLFTAASRDFMTFQEIVRKLAAGIGNSPMFIPVPWQLGWLGLKFFEVMGKTLSFKSDSLVSLMKPNPSMAFDDILALGAPFRKPLENTQNRYASETAVQL